MSPKTHRVFTKRKNELIKKESAVVILIDMQVEYVENLRFREARRIIPNQITVLKYCNRFNIPVIVLELDPEFNGKTIKILIKYAKKNSNFHFISKSSNSGFEGTSLDYLLKKLGARKLLLMGINADYCVLSTAADAIKKGYEIITSEDFISGQSHHSKNNSVPWFKKNGNYVQSVAELAGMIQ